MAERVDAGRAALLALLDRHVERWPDDGEMAARIRDLVARRVDCFRRSCVDPGHITASAWILSPDRSRSLFTHHRKLGRWLQLGGHADGVADPLEVALTEAREESGMEDFDVLLDGAPIDVDVHAIPARKRDPEHEHHDIRFLLQARPGQDLAMSDESLDLRWFGPEDLEELLAAEGESLIRMARRVSSFLRGP